MIGKRNPEKDQDYYNGLIESIWYNLVEVKSELTGIKEEVTNTIHLKKTQDTLVLKDYP